MHSPLLDQFSALMGYGIWVVLGTFMVWVAALGFLILWQRPQWNRWRDEATIIATDLQADSYFNARHSNFLTAEHLRVWLVDGKKCGFLGEFIADLAREAWQQGYVPTARDVMDDFADLNRVIIRHLNYIRSMCPLMAVLGVACGVAPFARSLGAAQMDTVAFAGSFHATVIGLAVGLSAHTLLFWMRGWMDGNGRRLGHAIALIVRRQQQVALQQPRALEPPTET